MTISPYPPSIYPPEHYWPLAGITALTAPARNSRMANRSALLQNSP